MNFLTDNQVKTIARVIEKVEGSTGNKSPQSLPSGANARFLVRLTADKGNGKKWDAERVYIDENGDPQIIEGAKEFLDSEGNAVFTLSQSSVGDVIFAERGARIVNDKKASFWLGGSSGGGGGINIIPAKYKSAGKAVIIGTEAIPPDPNPEVDIIHTYEYELDTIIGLVSSGSAYYVIENGNL